MLALLGVQELKKHPEAAAFFCAFPERTHKKEFSVWKANNLEIGMNGL